MADKNVVSPLDKRTSILHDVAIRLAEMNVNSQLEAAVPMLEFLEDIEDKTADDLRRIRTQEKLVNILSGQDYRGRLQNIFAEKMALLSDEHLTQYRDDLIYQEAIADMNVQIVPALQEVQEELLYGVVTKPTLQ